MNDALFPLGAFSHSYGLETYIQNGLVSDVAGAAAFLRPWIGAAFLYGDLLCAALAWDCGGNRDAAALAKLEEIARASKGPRELREAARKIGSRFARTLLPLLPLAGFDASFLEDCLLGKEGPPSHACAYGAVSGCLGIGKEDAMEAFLYAQVSSLTTCCVKTIPLSQTAGQALLTGLFGLMQTTLARLATLGIDDLYRGCPGFDLRSMEHETLYSRLYMS
jgi:urease accessory protein